MANDFVDEFLNEKYGNDDLTNTITQSRSRALKELWTVKQGGGDSQVSRFTMAGSGSSASTLAVAQTIDSTRVNGTKFAWNVPYAVTEGSITVPYVDIVASRGADDAATRALEDAIDTGLEKFGTDLQGNLLGSPTLHKGVGVYDDQAAGSAPVFSITFTEAADAAGFNYGDQVVVDTAADGQTISAATGYVVDVDTDTGYIQVGTTASAGTAGNPGTGWTDGATVFVFAATMVQATTTSYDTGVVPMGAYLPTTRASDTLLNVNRALDSRLSGNRNAVGSSKLARLRNMIAKMANRSSDMFAEDIAIVCNIEDVEAISQELSATVQQTTDKSTTDGYISFHILTALGQVAVIGDRKKSKGSAFVLNKRHLCLYSSGSENLASLVKMGGGNILRAKDASNDMEVRPFARLAHVIGAPYMHGVVTF